MVNLKYRVLAVVVTVAFAGHGFAEDIKRHEADALMRECHSQRQQQIALHKKQAIGDCVNQQRQSQEYCEQFYSDLGERSAGGRLPGLYWDIPACEKAVAVEEYFNMYPGRQVYSYP